MIKSFVDELIEANKRIPRRLYTNESKRFVTSRGRVVEPTFLALDILRCNNPRSAGLEPDTYLFGIEPPESGSRKVHDVITGVEAGLILGYDLLNERVLEEEKDFEIQTMLETCQKKHVNAYYLESRSRIFDMDFISFPVAYFRISSQTHRSLEVNLQDERFKDLIKRVKK